MLTPFRNAISCLAFAFIAGCGGGSELVCEPECPARYHCTDTGCVPDDNSAIDLSMQPSGDMAGDCVPTCAAPTPYCVDGRCMACRSDGECPSGQVCKAVGAVKTCIPGCTDDARCRAGGNMAMACCNGGCFDTSKDVNNCGACGKSCGGINSQASCQGGACVPGACNSGWGDCNANAADGCETNLHFDPANCGMCGSACRLSNAIPGCSDGCYISACQFGWDDCNGETKDGCETSVLSDANNCGACGNVCGGVPHAEAICVNAGCQLKQCDVGYTDCNGNSKDGCETVIASDVKNCGACGVVCAQGLVCTNGSCTCPQCKIPNAQSKCINNQCIFDKCLPGYSDCDNNPANGCEVSTDTDPANCGSCGKACPMNLPGCSAGQCVNGWFPVGVQQNVPLNMLAGWSECFRESFGNAGTSIQQILKQCSGGRLMMACAQTGAKTLTLAAWAPRADVTFPTNGSGNCPDVNVHQANGVGWYYDNDWSWGFVKGGDAPENCSCDVSNVNPQFRMCWHTSVGTVDPGYRCGADEGVDRGWDRIIYQF